MLIAGGSVFTGEDIVEADIVVNGDRIESVEALDASRVQAAREAGEQVVDAAGLIVAPGLVDVHFHGCVGKDLCDASAEALHEIAAYQASRGVTAICPATMTYPEDRLAAVMREVRAFVPGSQESALVGVNMEGPFISPARVGAQNPDFVQACDAAMFRRLQRESGGFVKLVDVAPEEPGALEFIREMSDEVRISLAHMCADYECAAEAFDAGARQMTHLFNAMPGLHHRDPGPIAAAAERADVMAEVIADGVHVHPAMVRLAFNLFGDDRIILISDSMRACGMGDGVFDLGGQDVHVRGNEALLSNGTLAGSVSDLASCVRTAVRSMGVPVESALKAASANPARALGIEGERGSVKSGYVADFVMFDSDLRVDKVIVRGRLLNA